MEISKRTLVLIAAVLLCVGGSVWYYVSTNDVRKADAQFEQLVKLANRQAVEIAVIEQTSKLQNYRQQIAQAQKKQKQAMVQRTVPNYPIIADPKDVNVREEYGK